MLNRDEFILHRLCLLFRLSEYCVDRLGNINLVGFTTGAGNFRDALNLAIARGLHARGVDVQLLHQLWNQAALLIEQRIKKMLLINLHILIANHDFLCLANRFHRFDGVFILIHKNPP